MWSAYLGKPCFVVKNNRVIFVTFSISSLLSHEDDSHVADGALKCFASLADRFIRKNVDPMPLATHGLTKELLNRLSNAGNRSQLASSGTPSGAGATSGQGFEILNFILQLLLSCANKKSLFDQRINLPQRFRLQSAFCRPFVEDLSQLLTAF